MNLLNKSNVSVFSSINLWADILAFIILFYSWKINLDTFLESKNLVSLIFFHPTFNKTPRKIERMKITFKNKMRIKST